MPRKQVSYWCRTLGFTRIAHQMQQWAREHSKPIELISQHNIYTKTKYKHHNTHSPEHSTLSAYTERFFCKSHLFMTFSHGISSCSSHCVTFLLYELCTDGIQCVVCRNFESLSTTTTTTTTRKNFLLRSSLCWNMPTRTQINERPSGKNGRSYANSMNESGFNTNKSLAIILLYVWTVWVWSK